MNTNVDHQGLNTTKDLALAVAEAASEYLLASSNAQVAASPILTLKRIKLVLEIEAMLRHFANYPDVWQVASIVAKDLAQGPDSSFDDIVLDAIGYASAALQEIADITDLKPISNMRGQGVRSGYSFNVGGREVAVTVGPEELATNELTYTAINIFKSTVELNLPSSIDASEAVLKTLLEKRPGTNNDMFHIFKYAVGTN